MNRRNFAQMLASGVAFLFPSFSFAKTPKFNMIDVEGVKYYYKNLVDGKLVNYIKEIQNGTKLKENCIEKMDQLLNGTMKPKNGG